ncbi:hypothetical protein BO78DRAFT_439044 [Aspergillus sclerotiicarbonarius CBS 121057]|uniref:GST N-terminal domain-containing protein n=1 Tax=Aspergillus sclerotiicarbonarius (strain CBS 121057 / IBT 28362) TaxID=1448318 RepID=A0A319DRH9_ASPSB|nr:hypothetical protein BO78DRAFT_439044 [Aspergillus sclerotiicarbonarius CBS 121057]
MSNPPSIIYMGNHPLPALPTNTSPSDSPIYSPTSTPPPSWLLQPPQSPQWLHPPPSPPPHQPQIQPSHSNSPSNSNSHPNQDKNLPKIYILDGDTATGLSIRHFIRERGGLRIRSSFLPVIPKSHIHPSLVSEPTYTGDLPVLFLDHPARRPVRKIVGFGAITEYLDGVAVGGRRLYGETGEERAGVSSLVYVLEREVVGPLYEWSNLVYCEVGDGLGEKEGLRRRVRAGLQRVEEGLEERERGRRRRRDLEETGYLLGKFSAADVYFFGLVVAHVGRWEWIFDEGQRPRVTEYFDRVRQRPMTDLAGEFWDTETTTVVESGERWGYI